MTERATARPVTLSRLVELTNATESAPQTTDELQEALDVNKRRARETILEALRIGLLDEQDGDQADDDADPAYTLTDEGQTLLSAVRAEDWSRASGVLERGSPHYNAFLETVRSVGPAQPETILDKLQSRSKSSEYDYNKTSIDVVGDWGERLGSIQRNAFTKSYYRVSQFENHDDFLPTLLSVFDDLEETAGVNLSQRYLSIPKLREYTCEKLQCKRDVFDRQLVELVNQNIGKLELSGAPVDTGAKDALVGIKQISLSTEGTLVSTDQSTEPVMAGVEQFGKQYYYLAVHDEELSYDPQTEQ